MDTRAPYYVAVASAERQFDPEALEELMSSIKAPLEHAGLLNDQLSPTQARFLDANRMALPSFKVFEIVGRRITRLNVEDLDIPYFNSQQDGSEDILSRYITVTLYPSIEVARAAEKAHIVIGLTLRQ